MKKFNIQKLGPGLLFAGAAIGVSHLVQSTRAGADFGWGLLCTLVIQQFIQVIVDVSPFGIVELHSL